MTKMYLAVTADKYEQIMDFDVNVGRLAERFGLSKGTVECEISKNNSGKRRGYAFRKVEIEDD